MRKRCIALGILVFVLAVATTGLAKGGPPDHAASSDGPPAGGSAEEGAGPDRGPPAHADSAHAEPENQDDSGDDPEGDLQGDTGEDPQEDADGDAEAGSDATARTQTQTETTADAEDSGPDRSTTTTATGSAASDEPPAEDEPTRTVGTSATLGEAGLNPAVDQEQAGIDDGSLVPLAGSGWEAASQETTGSPASAGSGVSGLLVGLIPGTLIGAIGVLALAVHGGSPGQRGRARAVESEPTSEPTEDADQATEPSPATTDGGVVGVITMGQDALDEGDVEAAAGWFETATDLAPGLQVAHFCLGLCLDDLGRLDEAEQRLREARNLEDDPMTAYAHASVLARLGRTRESVEELERLTDRVPELRERLAHDDELANLRDHPRFLALLGHL